LIINMKVNPIQKLGNLLNIWKQNLIKISHLLNGSHLSLVY
jgi:hypothetical protein